MPCVSHHSNHRLDSGRQLELRGGKMARNWYPCSFTQITNTRDVNNLKAAILESSCDILNIDNQSSTFAAISDGTNVPKNRTLFVSLIVVKEIEELPLTCGNCNEDIKNSIQLFVSKTFFTKYPFCKPSMTFFMKIVTPFPLEKVVLGTTSSDTYNLISQDNWTMQLMLKVCNQKILCRQGEAFIWIGTSDIIVLECQPLFQGLLSIKTEITVVKYEQSFNKEYDNELTISSPSNQTPNIVAHWGLMQYLSWFLFPLLLKKTEALNPVLLIKAAACRKVIGIIKLKFPIRIVPVDPFLLNYNDLVIDPTNTIFMYEKTARSLCIRNGMWVLVSLSNDDQENQIGEGCVDSATLKKRWVQVCCLPCNLLRMNVFGYLDENTVHLGPNLWFNLNHHPSLLIQPNTKLTILKIHFDNEPNPILFATEVNVNLVQSPDCDSDESFDVLLDNYFERQRYIQLGDIITIRSSVWPHFKGSNSSYGNSGVVYFKVSKIINKSKTADNSTGFFISKNLTTLYQLPSVFSYVPVTMDVHLGLKQVHGIWHNPLPIGFENYIKQLQDIIYPYLTFSSLSEYVLPSILLCGASGCGKMTILYALSRILNMHLFSVDCYDLLADTAGATAVRITQIFVKASKFLPCLFVMRNIHVLGKRENNEDERVVQSFRENFEFVSNNKDVPPIILVGVTTKPDALLSDLGSLFLHQVLIDDLAEFQRKEILNVLLGNKFIASDVVSDHIAAETKGFVLSDLCALVSKSAHSANNRLLRMVGKTFTSFNLDENDKEDLVLSGVFIRKSDFESTLDLMMEEESDFMQAPEVPNVQWDDVGGLEDVKQSILDTIQLPLQHPELFASGLRRSGILLFGPPGTGKTLLAKAVATECKLHFLSVKGPELLNMYVGQSEENVREVFTRARNVSPCVIFFDELDSLAPNRGRSGDSGGVMDRVVSQLLAELDGLGKTSTVYVIGATNRPDLIDPALLRPGRFDKLLYIGIAEDLTSKVKILKALTRKFNLYEDVNLDEIASILPPTTTGADLYALCSDALTNSLSKCVQQILKDPDTSLDEPLIVRMEDLTIAATNLVPSVSFEELEKYKKVKIKALSS